MKFKDKVILITGSSRGVGRATALEFAKEGGAVAVNFNGSKEKADQLVGEIKNSGGVAEAFKCDVSNEEEVKNLIISVVEKFGKLDILVNNAAIVFDVPFFEKTVEQWTKTMSVNLIGAFLCSKYASDLLVKSNGNIINVCSNSGYNSFAPTSADYDSSKVGLISLTKNLAKELAPTVRVNAVAPSWVDTDMNINLPKEVLDEEVGKILLGRMARPDEIAKTILFLASDDASYLTGSILFADGGMV